MEFLDSHRLFPHAVELASCQQPAHFRIGQVLLAPLGVDDGDAPHLAQVGVQEPDDA